MDYIFGVKELIDENLIKWIFWLLSTLTVFRLSLGKEYVRIDGSTSQAKRRLFKFTRDTFNMLAGFGETVIQWQFKNTRTLQVPSLPQ